MKQTYLVGVGTISGSCYGFNLSINSSIFDIQWNETIRDICYNGNYSKRLLHCLKIAIKTVPFLSRIYYLIYIAREFQVRTYKCCSMFDDKIPLLFYNNINPCICTMITQFHLRSHISHRPICRTLHSIISFDEKLFNSLRCIIFEQIFT